MTPIFNLPPIIGASGQFVDPRLNPTAGAAPGAPTGAGAVAPNGTVGAADSFAQTLTNAIGSLSGLQTNADQAVAGLAMNQGMDIHQAMIAMQQASLGMSLAVQVRDKAVEAYQSLLNMQM